MYPTSAFRASLSRHLLLAALSLATLVTASDAAPYIPSNDATPLERLATNVSSSRERQADAALRTMLARNPKNVEIATRAAQRYLSRARIESDPRLLGQAQAVLAPWWSLAEPPNAVLLMRATIRQSNHDFDNARSDLEQLVKRDPSNAQAWITLATVQQVSGDLNAATQSCKTLKPLTTALVSTTCLAAIDGSRGLASNAYEALSAVIASPNFATESMGVRTWALTLQAELAERVGRTSDAERLYRASLSLDPADVYTISMYSDFLIDAQRFNEVLTLIPATTRADILLLRCAIAAKHASSTDATQIAEELTKRFAASTARGDRLHLREESRFTLAIKNAPTEALALALDNWRVQKEPLDARIALEAAVAAKQPKAVADVLAWLEANPLQSAKLTALVQQVRAAS
jgi:predicted Zn-dependent protease